MKKYRWLFLILIPLLFVGCQSGDKGPQGFILFQTLDQDGQFQELIVVDPKGEEQHRMPMSDPMRRGTPLEVGHKALVDTMGGLYLVDAQEGTAQLLPLEDEAFPRVPHFRFSGGGERWVLLGNFRGNLAYLLNLETGQVHDVTTLAEGSSPILYGLFAPNEEHVLLGIGSDLWLVPTANLDDARRLGTGKTAFASSFSSDGEQVAYVQRVESGEFEVVLEAVDGSESEVVATADFVQGIAFVPGEKQLLLITREEASESKAILLSLDDGQERELLSRSEPVARYWLAPSGEKVLLEDASEVVWHLVDVQDAEAQTLDDLQGYHPLWRDRDHRWVFCLDNTSFGAGEHHFVSLDLESGVIKQAMDMDEELMYLGLSDVAAEGRYGLVTTTNPDKQMELWLLQADGGEPRLLAEANAVNGSFSPDGEWVAVSTLTHTDGDQIETSVTLMEIEGDETRSVGEGVRPVWVRP